MILRGAAQFFGDEKGACVTEVITYPRRRVLHVWLAFGELETCLGSHSPDGGICAGEWMYGPHGNRSRRMVAVAEGPRMAQVWPRDGEGSLVECASLPTISALILPLLT